MLRLEKIEKEYPIKIEDYLGSEVKLHFLFVSTNAIIYYRDILIGVFLAYLQ
jgi:hypothetical protein